MILRLALALILSCGLSAAAAPCPPQGKTRAELLELRDRAFAVADDQERNALAQGLLDCLADSDPELRDGVAFEALSTWLRAETLERKTIRQLTAKLLQVLDRPDNSEQVHHAFAILVLSELARADRIQPMLSARQRESLVDAASAFMRGIDDYRGFDEAVGWRHQVAHSADLVLQLAINPAVNAEQAAELLEALGTQIAPFGIAYTQGEPERLARAVFFAHQRGLLQDQWWQQWFARISAPPAGGEWSRTFKSSAGLTYRHDTLAFLYALNFAADSAEGVQAEVLQMLVRQAITAVLS
jgi:hypothetical protein